MAYASSKNGNPRKIDGLVVKNLTKKIKLVISDEDCRKGNKKNPNSCAAAIAATRQVPNCIEARIHIGRIYLKVKTGNKEYWLRGKTPGALRTEIATFDRGGTFEPGTYDINPLCASELPNGRARDPAPKYNHGRAGKHHPKPRVLKDVRGGARAEYGTK